MSESDQHESDEQQNPKYVVRLIMGAYSVATPQAAVTGFVDALVAQGLRDWVYEVIDVDSGQTVGEYNGYGEDASGLMENLREEAEAESTPDEDEDEDEPKEDLLALAENLNAGN